MLLITPQHTHTHTLLLILANLRLIFFRLCSANMKQSQPAILDFSSSSFVVVSTCPQDKFCTEFEITGAATVPSNIL